MVCVIASTCETRRGSMEQLEFEFVQGRWQLVWRYVYFQPSEQPDST